MKQYLDFARSVFEGGAEKTDRTGTGTRSVFGAQMRFDLKAGFPLVTTKKVPFRLIAAELLWFLSGSTNNNDLKARGCDIWDEWARPNGDLGPIYGRQWRAWEQGDGSTHDQIADAIHLLKTQPDSRRILVSAWNVADLPAMALSPCHALFQFYSAPMSVAERIAHHGERVDLDTPEPEFAHAILDDLGVPRMKLSCQLYQRSADIFLGVPFNIASYALLTHMVAQQCDMAVGEFIWTGGDCHIYKNHFEQIATQLGRDPLPLPMLQMRHRPDDIGGYTPEHFELVGYESHAAIKGDVAV